MKQRIIRIRDEAGNFHGMLIIPSMLAYQLKDDINKSFSSMESTYTNLLKITAGLGNATDLENTAGLGYTAELGELLTITPEIHKECPICGCEDTWSNSSDELQCDSCGYEETNESLEEDL